MAVVSWGKNGIGLLIRYTWYWVSRRNNGLPNVICWEWMRHQHGPWGMACGIPLGSCSAAPTPMHRHSGPTQQSLVKSCLHSRSLLPGWQVEHVPTSLAAPLELPVIVFWQQNLGGTDLEAIDHISGVSIDPCLSDPLSLSPFAWLEVKKSTMTKLQN